MELFFVFFLNKHNAIWGKWQRHTNECLVRLKAIIISSIACRPFQSQQCSFCYLTGLCYSVVLLPLPLLFLWSYFLRRWYDHVTRWPYGGRLRGSEGGGDRKSPEESKPGDQRLLIRSQRRYSEANSRMSLSTKLRTTSTVNNCWFLQNLPQVQANLAS